MGSQHLSEQTMPLRWPAPAKLNLFLRINNQREDGYHELQTLFQFIDRSDYLTISANLSGQITISPSIEGITLEDNLIYKAAVSLKDYYCVSRGAHIEIEKNLPMGAGLGGGSSNAATTLVALNWLWKLNLPLKKLAEIGLSLGADVPIFVLGGAAIAEGVGEKLTFAAPQENFYLVAVPQCKISTQAVFNAAELTRNTQKMAHKFLMEQKWVNDCELYVKNQHEEVANIINWLVQYAPTRLTGTGSCVFSTFSQKSDAKVVLDKTPKWLDAFVTQGMNTSPLKAFLSTIQKTETI